MSGAFRPQAVRLRNHRDNLNRQDADTIAHSINEPQRSLMAKPIRAIVRRNGIMRAVPVSDGEIMAAGAFMLLDYH